MGYVDKNGGELPFNWRCPTTRYVWETKRTYDFDEYTEAIKVIKSDCDFRVFNAKTDICKRCGVEINY